MLKRILVFIFSLCICLVIRYSYAEYNLSGRVLHDSRILKGRGIYAENSRGEFTKSISRMEFRINRTDESGFSLMGELWATYDHLDSYADQFTEREDDTQRIDYDEFYIREAYISANIGPAELKIGKMLINWGRVDEINPIDIVNPEDFSEFYTIEKEERGIPILLADGLLYIGNFTLEAVWIPFFEPARMPTTGPWALKTFIDLQALLTPQQYASLDFSAKENEGKRDILNSETAARFSGLLGSLDFGLVFFYGFNDLPGLKTEVDDLGQPALVVTYRRFHGYGFDFAYSIAGYGFRGEALYRDKVLYPLSVSIVGFTNHTSSDIQSVLGIDKTFGDNFYVNVQLIYNRILDHTEDVLADEDLFMGMGTLEDLFFNDELKLGVGFFYGFNEADWLIFPYAEYRLTDNLKAESGVYIICGPDDSDIGQFDENDMVYLRASYSY
ncbi:MAG: DUF1302 family protein [Spirochaetota bacterium]|nr:DUF1302 family protein [Spirochaetota bacterium]